ncbi:putative cointegrate resolution protein T [gamma proteobacterium BDW918]|uniref:Integrase n=1 Tax=Zhongshania aliphaticivorans TaxID=1470434 RepID=A0A127M5G9_9GAMM|nr:DNA-binding protein [Zhongshania aliphaticivorans]AMO68431.1 integrase [Zhongshania aliphaticivorans]EIF43006.1 putative cointegrate resolution protein T [gamma proteobacterium BDW918]
MARGGINKALVLKAREEVLKKGQNPSIDTIRIALGNTGSKSTIHRYLKELEEESAIKMDDASLLSQPIKELVTRLAAGLREEANVIVEQQAVKFEQQLQDLRAQNSESTQALEALNKKYTSQSDTLECLETALVGKNAAVAKFEVDIAKATQTEAKLTALLKEKQTQIESLEEKHHHNREALEHYRQSVKEQREQDLRRHEQQVQLLQGENRVLNQTLSLKQSDVTQLNKDNSRLVSELGAAQKALSHLTSAKNELESRVKALDLSEQSLNIELLTSRDHIESYSVENGKLRQEYGDLQSKQQASIVKIAMLEAGVSAKNDVINQLIAGASGTAGVINDNAPDNHTK